MGFCGGVVGWDVICHVDSGVPFRRLRGAQSSHEVLQHLHCGVVWGVVGVGCCVGGVGWDLSP